MRHRLFWSASHTFQFFIIDIGKNDIFWSDRIFNQGRRRQYSHSYQLDISGVSHPISVFEPQIYGWIGLLIMRSSCSNKASEEEGKGGAIHAVSNSKIYVFYGQFVRNTANHGGALFAGKFSYVEIIESMYEENTASISVRI